MNAAMVGSDVDAIPLDGIRLRLPQPATDFVPIACNNDDLPVGDADLFVGVKRLRILLRFRDDIVTFVFNQ